MASMRRTLLTRRRAIALGSSATAGVRRSLGSQASSSLRFRSLLGRRSRRSGPSLFAAGTLPGGGVITNINAIESATRPALGRLFSSTGAARAGLLGFPELQRPEGFEELAARAKDRCTEFVKIVESGQTHGAGTLRALDEISDAVCAVCDMSEFVRNVHEDPRYREAADACFADLSAFIQELNANRALHGSLVDLMEKDGGAGMAQMTEEQRRMATLLRAEFERDGIHLPPADRRRVMDTQNEVTRVGMEFQRNLVRPVPDVALAPRNAIMQALPGHLRRIADERTQLAAQHLREQSGGQQSFDDAVALPTDALFASTVLKQVTDRHIRRAMYVAHGRTCEENVAVLEHLAAQRHSLATQLDFPSYGHLAADGTLAGSPQAITDFLQDMSHQLAGKAEAEMGLLRGANRRIFGAKEDPPGSGVSPADRVEAWDRAFLMGIVKAERARVDGSELKDYLSVSNCLDGIGLLVQRLFGIELREVPFDEGEAWLASDDNLDAGLGSSLRGLFGGAGGAANSSGGIGSTSSGGGNNGTLRKLVLWHEREGAVGHIYLDLFPRPGKYNHAAHFTVRCGRRLEDGSYQLPVVALVCNFANGSGGAGGGGGTLTSAEDVLISHGEVETLFHEFGHALHSVLSRTEFQHLSGTRGKLDFVELPSHLMEYFVWDWRVLREFATHYATKEPVPRDLVEAHRASKYMFAGLDTQLQVLYARFDQQVFGPPPADGSPVDSTAILRELQNAHTAIPYVEDTYWHARFGHAVGYGAGYYSYLYARVFAAHIWERCFAEDPLNRQVRPNNNKRGNKH